MRLEVVVLGTSVTIVDCRRTWAGSRGGWFRIDIAQLRYDPAVQRWTLYWADAAERWRLCEDLGQLELDEMIAEINRNPIRIFFG
jgi:hypothetical protein